MKLLNNRIGLEFDLNHNKNVAIGLNGIEIVRPDKWLYKDGDEETHTKFSENLNYLETKPQLATVTHPSANHDYKVGDKLFLHYMAYETAESSEYGMISETDFILFKINPDETFELVDDLFLGEQQYIPEHVRPSGIIIAITKKDSLRVKITHIAENKATSVVKQGDIVISIDDKNYEFDYNGKKYIKLMADEIVAKISDDKLIPLVA